MSKIVTATRPAEVFPPGEFLREELETRGWTLPVFASTLGYSQDTVENVLTGEVVITNDIAQRLAHVLGTSPELWLNLEASFRSRHN